MSLKRQFGVIAVLMMITAVFSSAAQSRSTVSQARQLASAKVQVRSLKRQVHALHGAVRFYSPGHKGHWALHAGYKRCYQVTGWQRVKVCRNARRTLAATLETLPSLEQQLLIKQVHILYLQIDPSEISNFTCIHKGEGGWQSNTGNGYYGGFQMDEGFMQTYGPDFESVWGYADNWPIEAQYVAAHRAKVGFGGYDARGYGPWPKTGPNCGL